jgi:hypothetical protein
MTCLSAASMGEQGLRQTGRTAIVSTSVGGVPGTRPERRLVNRNPA